ncbi:hypothetical protein CTheo_5827 [Ceratobasidium theobromae]|uniref:Uncharacterized protein n=1 Tax=Ceratobasidium theobromae TaxID=1582974 RepID=A0A5N5QH01_9AGAM|nr:hypothetical protein CTheo_5827 [Ceratobasidium theobromae]
MFAFGTLAITASLAAVVIADHGHNLLGRSHHHHIDHAALHKRAYTGQATYYAVGLGACGQYSQPSDFIVALNSAQYGGGYPGPHCFQSVRICKTGTDNCQNAVIMDECPTCAYGSLDMSEGLFKAFSSLDAGVFPISWTFAGESSDDNPPKPTTTKENKPTTTWKPEPTPEPTTTWEPPTTTSSKKKTTTSPPPETTSSEEPTTTSSTSSTPTTTSTTETPTSTSTSVATSTSSSTTSSAAPSATAASSGSGGAQGSSGNSNLKDANEIVLALGQLAVVAHSAK